MGLNANDQDIQEDFVMQSPLSTFSFTPANTIRNLKSRKDDSKVYLLKSGL